MKVHLPQGADAVREHTIVLTKKILIIMYTHVRILTIGPDFVYCSPNEKTKPPLDQIFHPPVLGWPKKAQFASLLFLPQNLGLGCVVMKNLANGSTHDWLIETVEAFLMVYKKLQLYRSE